MELTPVQRKFILHWGDMGTRWGINRTVAQIHAMLYISPVPLPAEVLAETLSVSRSNVSTSIRELQGWGILKTVNMIGDRRDHFETLRDPWELFQIIMDERKKREIDPTLVLLRECVADLKPARDTADVFTRDRLAALLDFFETMSTWYSQLRCLPTQGLIKFVRTGTRIKELFSRRRQ